METVARLAVVALLVVPLVVLVVRTPRRRLGVRTDAAHGGATGQGVGVGAGVEPPNRFSAEIASWTA